MASSSLLVPNLCDVRDVVDDRYNAFVRLLTFGTRTSELRDEILRVDDVAFNGRTVFLDAAFHSRIFERNLPLDVTSFGAAAKIVDSMRQGKPIDGLLFSDHNTGFFSHLAHARLSLHTDRGILAIGDRHDKNFHLPALTEERNVENLRRRSRITIRYLEALIAVFERRGRTIRLESQHTRQTLLPRIEPADPELEELYTVAHELIQAARWATWEHLPNYRDNPPPGLPKLMILGGLGENLIKAISQAPERWHSQKKVKEIFKSRLLNQWAFLLPSVGGLRKQLVEQQKPSMVRFLKAREAMGVSGQKGLDRLVNKMSREMYERRPTATISIGSVSREVTMLQFLDQLTQMIGEQQEYRRLFDYELRQKFATASLDVFEDLVDLHIAQMEQIR